ncbi:hypothetical protein [Ileibacterium valens]|nr:hypothetical protein [Ileibacterium valens]
MIHIRENSVGDQIWRFAYCTHIQVIEVSREFFDLFPFLFTFDITVR